MSLRIRCFTIFIIHKYSIYFLYYKYIEFIILLYNYLLISFAQYKKYVICVVSFSKFSDVLPTIVSAWVLIPPSKPHPGNFFCPTRH